MCPSSAVATVRAGERPIAVLALTNLSDTTALDYLCDGLAEEIRYLLGRMHRLRILAGASSPVFRGRHGAGLARVPRDVCYRVGQLRLAPVTSCLSRGSLRRFGQSDHTCCRFSGGRGSLDLDPAADLQ